MKILLDTHIWIWAIEDPKKLGPRATKLLKDEKNELFVSPISSLEIAQLEYRGRVAFNSSISSWIESSFESLGLKTATLDHKTAIETYQFDFKGDPVDRLLIGTSKCLNIPLMTADKFILAFEDVASLNAKK